MSRRILITAGPTREPIDPVRYIANRSSGKMGIEIARAASAANFSVTLLLGPVQLDPPMNADIHRFETCDQLQSLLEQHFDMCDVLIMAAAVADYQPVAAANEKIPRSNGDLTLNFKPTPDLVAACADRKRPDQFIVGFALENPAQLEARAREKLSRKGLDAIVANPLETMGSQRINATIITSTGEVIHPEGDDAIDKAQFAQFLIRWIDDTAPKCH